MLSTKTFNRIVKSRSARVHEGHFSQKDKHFNGVEAFSCTRTVEFNSVQLEKVQESNGNWHNVVYVQQ